MAAGSEIQYLDEAGLATVVDQINSRYLSKDSLTIAQSAALSNAFYACLKTVTYHEECPILTNRYEIGTFDITLEGYTPISIAGWETYPTDDSGSNLIYFNKLEIDVDNMVLNYNVGNSWWDSSSSFDVTVMYIRTDGSVEEEEEAGSDIVTWALWTNTSSSSTNAVFKSENKYTDGTNLSILCYNYDYTGIDVDGEYNDNEYDSSGYCIYSNRNTGYAMSSYYKGMSAGYIPYLTIGGWEKACTVTIRFAGTNTNANAYNWYVISSNPSTSSSSRDIGAAYTIAYSSLTEVTFTLPAGSTYYMAFNGIRIFDITADFSS